jgi:hypothetical protein
LGRRFSMEIPKSIRKDQFFFLLNNNFHFT